jgi:hypothetical protein
MTHAVIILALASRCLPLQHLDDDRAFGWDESVGTVNAVALGYIVSPPLSLKFT